MEMKKVNAGALGLLGSIMLLGVLCFALYATFASVHYRWNWQSLWEYRMQFLHGWLTTLIISGGAMFVSIILGFALMLGCRSILQPVRFFCTGTVEIVRGSPLLVQLLIGYYVIATALGVSDPTLVGTLLLGLFEAAYLAEIFRGAVESIGRSQWEASKAVGFDKAQTYRFVIIPQAVRRALPGTTGELVSLIKSSSLLSVIGIEELVQKVRVMNSASYTALEGYLPLAIAYLVVTLPLSWTARRLEQRFTYET